MLTCSKLGVHFSVIFEELEEQAILNRVNLLEPSLIISNLPKKNFY